MMDDFSDEELKRYARHLVLDGVGEDGQRRIREASVLVIGTGGLGSPVTLYLAAAGVGHLGIVDFDNVDYSNLQRQVVHSTNDVGRPKVLSAREKLVRLNPHVSVDAYQDMFTAGNARSYVSGYDFVVDATDNFPVKYLINDACVLEGKPFSIGGISEYCGQTMTHIPGTACYRCVFPDEPASPKLSERGVLGAIAGMLGTIQAAEVLKYFTGVGELLTNRLLTFDSRTMDFQKLELSRNPDCPLCGQSTQIFD